MIISIDAITPDEDKQLEEAEREMKKLGYHSWGGIEYTELAGTPMERRRRKRNYANRPFPTISTTNEHTPPTSDQVHARYKRLTNLLSKGRSVRHLVMRNPQQPDGLK